MGGYPSWMPPSKGTSTSSGQELKQTRYCLYAPGSHASIRCLSSRDSSLITVPSLITRPIGGHRGDMVNSRANRTARVLR